MLRSSSASRIPAVVIVARSRCPVPATIAIAAVAKIAAAVVMPRTNWFSPCSTTPAPMKPIPVIAPATACGASRQSTAVIPAIDAPRRPNVRSPAGEARSSRSKPTVNARANPRATRARRSQSEGTRPRDHTVTGAAVDGRAWRSGRGRSVAAQTLSRSTSSTAGAANWAL